MWAVASRCALDHHRELPINLPGISDATYGKWEAIMTMAYGAAGENSIRGVHACLAEVLAPLSRWGPRAVACLSFAL